MTEENKKKKKEFGFFFDDLFIDFDKEMERMQKEMEDVLSKMNKENKFEKYGKSKVYGFSLKVGSDGKPKLQEFGNIKPRKKPKQNKNLILFEERKPLIDVFKLNGEIIVIAEVPGATKSDVKLNGTKDTLKITVNGRRKYYHDLKLPANANQRSRKFTCKNGILEVRIQIKD